MTRFIFITGGVVSSLGKGIASAGIAALLQCRGYKVKLRKLDPYLNVDPGTMSPYQHGEVFVTDDGAETDLDLGHYERFTGNSCTKLDNATTGRIYQNIIAKERRGDYIGATVQVIPHVSDEIKRFIAADSDNFDFVLCEVGGTVGDIEALPFFEAIRQFGNDRPADQTLYVHLTWIPFVPAAGELKTKPTQHSVKELRSIGIQPNILLIRSAHRLPADQCRKIALFCNVKLQAVIQALDVDNIYQVPLSYHSQHLDDEIIKAFGLESQPPDLSKWIDICERIDNPEGMVRIAIVGKYTGLKDAYMSLVEALHHGGIANRTKVAIKWIDADSVNDDINTLSDFDGIIVPGGFGERGAEGKITAVQFARENNIPFFGICFGMQMACIEVARNVLAIKDASSSEFGPTSEPVVGLLTEWLKDDELQLRDIGDDLGGTMRLGSYPAVLASDSRLANIYDTTEINERHRHRYEVNAKYKQKLEQAGLIFSGMSPDGLLPEAVEFTDHPWFIGVQFHPELKSRPLEPHPLFKSFIAAAIKHERLL